MKQFRDTKYFVGKSGEVFNSKRQVYLKPWKNSSGYLDINLGAGFRISIHRLVAEVYCEGFDLSLDVNHKDGDKLNNHYSNLEWVTRSENCQHSYDNGLSKRRLGHTDSVGSKNAMAVLNDEIVKEIRSLFKTGNFTQTALAKKFNITPSNIGCIIKRKTWKHLE